MQNDPNRINVRIYKRLPTGTIVIWNTDVLTQEQKDNVLVGVRRITDNKWLVPICSTPDVARMGNVMDGNTDTIMIVHDERINEDTPFIIRLTFGKVEQREATLRVSGKSGAPYIKPIRTASGVYAMPIEWPNLPLVRARDGTMALPVIIIDDYRSGTPLPPQPLEKPKKTEE